MNMTSKTYIFGFLYENAGHLTSATPSRTIPECSARRTVFEQQISSIGPLVFSFLSFRPHHGGLLSTALCNMLLDSGTSKREEASREIDHLPRQRAHDGGPTWTDWWTFLTMMHREKSEGLSYLWKKLGNGSKQLELIEEIV